MPAWTLLFCGLIFSFVLENHGEKRRQPCYNDTDHGFIKVHLKMLRALHWHRHPNLRPVHHAANTCKHFLSELSAGRSSQELSHRSLAPWRTRTVENHDMYPSRYEEAECLCDGCIINGVENHSYNSVPVEQTFLFLKKIKCPSDPSKYSIEYEKVNVRVACTCVVPRS
ncbi:interleukin-17C [Triplophysa dalaica]|uniref:interleukin-17C n=1 Tax=Triplophysa dalaica TaxID=1582913 RepID=UPI0024DF8E33|nr:interleukin-17C [Triplophysa dalaica]